MRRPSLIGFGMVLATCLLIACWQASAQTPNASSEVRWEYTAIRFDSGEDPDRVSPIFTQRMNQLATAGWHYVGPLTEYSKRVELQVNESTTHTSTWVAFKRQVK